MWVNAAAPSMAKLRHKCEQDEVDRYGFSAHDGRGFGVQPIVDSANAVALTVAASIPTSCHSHLQCDLRLIRSFAIHPLSPASQTSFVATDGGGWAVRIEGDDAPTTAQGTAANVHRPPKGQRQSLFFYLSVDAEYDAARQYDTETGRPMPAGGFERASPLPSQPTGAVHVAGHVREIGRFSVLAEARDSSGSGKHGGRGEGGSEGRGGEGGSGGGVEVRMWGSAHKQHSHLNVAELVGAEMDKQRQQVDHSS